MKKLLCLVFVLLIIFSGCGGKNPLTPTDNLKGSVTLAIKASGLTAKTIQPDLDMTIAAYDVYGVGPEGVNFRKNDQSSSTVSLEALAAGFWTITVDAKNDEGIIIASGYTDVTVITGITTSAGVTVTPLAGTGALKVNLSWPGGAISNPIIMATLAPKGGVASDISFTLTGDGLSALYENTVIEAGYYTLLVYLYDGTVFKWGAAEAVRIIKGEISEGNYPVIPGGADIGDINLIITPDLQNPVEITFTGATDNLLFRTNMTVNATTSEEVESYQWYLNGKPLSGETSDTITIGSALPRGNYRLDLLVAKRMIASSATLNFTVSDNGVTPVIALTALAGGENHSLALKVDGTVWAWGGNQYGQLGISGAPSTPTQVTGLTGAIAIASNSYHSMALKNDGTVWAWGDNNEGQLGNGTNATNGLGQVIGLNDVRAISAGYDHSLAVKNDGTAWAWGFNGYGELGDGTNSEQHSPVQVVGLDGVIAVSGGHIHSLALRNDGTVWAWGENSYCQLGDGTATNRNTPVQVNGLTGVIAIVAGRFHSLALKNDGTVWAWGWNYYGQLGNGSNSTLYYSVPEQVSGLSGVIAIGGGAAYSVALKNDGTVWAWGCNDQGQLGDGTNAIYYAPVQVSGLNGVISISSGAAHCLALRNDGTAWSWGNNNASQLGDGTYTSQNIPVQISF